MPRPSGTIDDLGLVSAGVTRNKKVLIWNAEYNRPGDALAHADACISLPAGTKAITHRSASH